MATGNRPIASTPVQISSGGIDVFSPPGIASGTGAGGGAASAYTTALRGVIKHIHVVNKSNAAATVTFYLETSSGATTSGNEVVCAGKSIPANDYEDFYTPGLIIPQGAYLVGKASVGGVLSATCHGDLY